MLTRKVAILAMIETIYGTDPVPTGGANAVLASEPKIEPMKMKTAKRNIVRESLGSSEETPVGVYSVVSFSVELAGAGAAGTVPAYGPLLRMCALAETITVGTKVTYAPVSGGYEAGTIYFNKDGLLRKLTGARGTVVLDVKNEDFPRMNFTFTGIYNDATDAVMPTLDLTKFIKPLPVCYSNTPTVSLHGATLKLETLSLDTGVSVTHDQRPGSPDEIIVSDRQAKFQAQWEAVSVGTKDWWSTIKSGTTGAMQVVHGKTAGNIVQIDAPVAQLLEPSDQDKNGKFMMSANGLLIPSTAGNDEFKLTVK